MSLEDLDEHEQGERVRAWLRQNGASIVLGIGAGLAALAGWHYWQQVQRDRIAQAQLAFQALVDAEQEQDSEAVAATAGAVRSAHGGTPYGVYAALHQARDAVTKGDLAAAEEALTWARGKSSGLVALDELVSIRLAQVKIAKGEGQSALDVLAKVDSPGYRALVGELRGDAYVLLGQTSQALSSYEESLSTLDVGSPQRSFVEMKRDDLTVAPAASATPPASAPAATESKASS